MAQQQPGSYRGGDEEDDGDDDDDDDDDDGGGDGDIRMKPTNRTQCPTLL